MIDYKKKIMEERKLPKEVMVHIKKCRKEFRCDNCLRMIKVGDVYFAHEYIQSYWCEHLGGYHLNCVSNEDIIKMSKDVLKDS